MRKMRNVGNTKIGTSQNAESDKYLQVAIAQNARGRNACSKKNAE